MAKHWEDDKAIKASINFEGGLGHALWLLGTIFAVLGVIGGAANCTLGLKSDTWMLLAIAAFVASAAAFIGWTMAVYLRSIEAKKE